jgi:hypothetical protein
LSPEPISFKFSIATWGKSTIVKRKSALNNPEGVGVATILMDPNQSRTLKASTVCGLIWTWRSIPFFQSYPCGARGIFFSLAGSLFVQLEVFLMCHAIQVLVLRAGFASQPF